MIRDEQKLLDVLSSYELSYACFQKYVTWICRNIPAHERGQYDLIGILSKGDTKRLARIEAFLNRSMGILRLSTREYVRAFGFSDDLLTSDPEKVHDILAEPLVVNSLDDHEFSNIKKISHPLRSEGGTVPTADLCADFRGVRYAIEIKTVRIEQDTQSDQPMGDAMKPSWWVEMLQNNIVTKIEDKQRRVIDQLVSTARHLGCDMTMLVIYTRRLGPSTLLDRSDVNEVLAITAGEYPQINCFCVKLVFGEVFFYPSLPNSEHDLRRSP